MSNDEPGGLPRRWAELRFSVIGGLLAAPPPHGELGRSIEALASKQWHHPATGEWTTFGASTIERWYYLAKDAVDPLGALTQSRRSDAGIFRAMSAALLIALRLQFGEHPGWSYKLQADNLAALVEEKPELGPAISYSTVRRVMIGHGMQPRRVPRNPTPGQRAAAARLEAREVRSYEASHVQALWHLDFHKGSLRVVDARGEWHTVKLLGILDDRSRLCCHAQWYLEEEAENLVHGLTQAICKRGLPRALMDDNGGAMRAAETLGGLSELGIRWEPTLAYSPYQNGKQEKFWDQVEGRPLAMLEGVADLSLGLLNRATLAWAECEYNRSRHDELGCSPLARYLEGPDVGRPAPEMERLQRAFCQEQSRTQRRSDGTLTLDGVRFELPSRLRTLRKVRGRWRRWDLSTAWVMDPRTREPLARIRPLDKEKNADGRRRALAPTGAAIAAAPRRPGEDGLAPLMRKYLAQMAATGLPPAYLPKDEALLAEATQPPHDEENNVG